MEIDTSDCACCNGPDRVAFTPLSLIGGGAESLGELGKSLSFQSLLHCCWNLEDSAKSNEITEAWSVKFGGGVGSKHSTRSLCVIIHSN